MSLPTNFIYKMPLYNFSEMFFNVLILLNNSVKLRH